MPDDQNIPQDTIIQDFILTTASEPTETSSEAQNAPTDGFILESQKVEEKRKPNPQNIVSAFPSPLLVI